VVVVVAVVALGAADRMGALLLPPRFSANTAPHQCTPPRSANAVLMRHAVHPRRAGAPPRRPSTRLCRARVLRRQAERAQAGPR
jgi:hypothetical protein